jgi:hypothetical protein
MIAESGASIERAAVWGAKAPVDAHLKQLAKSSGIDDKEQRQ